MSRRSLNLTALQAELHRKQGQLPTDCVVCGKPLPKGWHYREHARCHNPRSTHVPN
jgi:hypothetical protein